MEARQRLSYDRIGIGISEKKARIREPCVVRMGAEVAGITGFFLSIPRDKMLGNRVVSSLGHLETIGLASDNNGGAGPAHSML